MVGHTGDRDAAVLAVEAVDLCVGRLMKTIERLRGALIVTADHGNADEMYEHDEEQALVRDPQGKLRVKTSHTLNPVPMWLYAPSAGLAIDSTRPFPGLANVAATTLELLGFDSPEGYLPSLLRH
jgi:2,3-bisphosphoglycerate-independent phosphoglycerate mutase